MGEAVHLMPSSESASTLRAQVPELGSGSMTIELGPQLSRTLLILSLGGAQFHRLEGSRGVYLFDAQNTMVIDPEGSRRDHLDGSSPLRVTLSTELAGDQLRVSYSIAGSDGESPVTFESIELTAGS